MVTPLGLNRAASFESALQAKSAIGPAPDSIVRIRPHALAAQVSAGFATGQTLPSGGGVKSTRRASVASTVTISVAAKAAPMQMRGPAPKGR